MVISLGWNLYQARQDIQDMALTAARINFEKALLYRRWATIHGGVYVPVTPETPPNPYLEHMPERDLSTPSGSRDFKGLADSANPIFYFWVAFGQPSRDKPRFRFLVAFWVPDREFLVMDIQGVEI